jgi:hypothetical protein
LLIKTPTLATLASTLVPKHRNLSTTVENRDVTVAGSSTSTSSSSDSGGDSESIETNHDYRRRALFLTTVPGSDLGHPEVSSFFTISETLIKQLSLAFVEGKGACYGWWIVIPFATLLIVMISAAIGAVVLFCYSRHHQKKVFVISEMKMQSVDPCRPIVDRPAATTAATTAAITPAAASTAVAAFASEELTIVPSTAIVCPPQQADTSGCSHPAQDHHNHLDVLVLMETGSICDSDDKPATTTA